MTVIADRDRPTVRDVLARELVSDIELVLFTSGRSQPLDDGQVAGVSCAETRELLRELVKLSDRIHLTEHDVSIDPATATRYNVTAVPTVIIRKYASFPHSSIDVDAHPRFPNATLAVSPQSEDLRAASWVQEPDANVRFVGQPGGFEFSTLIADMVDISKGQTSLSEQSVAAVRAITTPVHLQVFVTPACPYCPKAARIAHQLAMTNPLVLADVIEANEFPALSERYRVQTVPKTIINDQIEFVGPLPEAKVVEAVLEAVSRRAE